MKKILAIILCLAMLLTLAACDTKEKSKKSKKDDKQEATTELSDIITNPDVDPETTVAPVTDEAPEASEAPETSEAENGEAHDHNHISYRGRTEYFTEQDLEAIEGRAWDFVYEQGEYNIYIYNNLEVDGMKFTQMQFTFNGSTARASGTYSSLGFKADGTDMTEEEMLAETEEVLVSYEKTLTELYGEGSKGEQHGTTYTSWSDHTGNYIIMTRINSSTVQVAFYIGTAE